MKTYQHYCYYIQLRPEKFYSYFVASKWNIFAQRLVTNILHFVPAKKIKKPASLWQHLSPNGGNFVSQPHKRHISTLPHYRITALTNYLCQNYFSVQCRT